MGSEANRQENAALTMSLRMFCGMDNSITAVVDYQEVDDPKLTQRAKPAPVNDSNNPRCRLPGQTGLSWADDTTDMLGRAAVTTLRAGPWGVTLVGLSQSHQLRQQRERPLGLACLRWMPTVYCGTQSPLPASLTGRALRKIFQSNRVSGSCVGIAIGH